MVTVTREGAIVQMEELSAEQREQGWLAVFSAFLRKNPDVLKTGEDSGKMQHAEC